jgi:NodT family efflux transporter outer membrane factor (OMF) lipoprotein
MRLALVIAAVLTSGCSLHAVAPAEDRDAGSASLPSRFAGGGGEGSAERSGRWWQALGDPALDAFVEGALDANLNVAGAWARIDQAKALVELAAAGRYPTVEATASAGLNRSQFRGFSRFSDQYLASVGASYEIDAWGRISSGVAAAEADARAARLDLDALAMTLVAGIASAWVELARTLEQRAVLQRHLDATRAQLAALDARFEQGIGSVVAVSQQRQLALQLESRLPELEGAVELLRHELAVLAGAPPGALAAQPSPALPAPPTLPDTGLPADLLRHRPDLRAAQLRVEAADHRVGAAIADQYPRFTLGGSLGFSGESIASQVAQWVFNLTAGMVAPLFDGGRRSAEVDRALAVVDERIHGLGQAWLIALREVSDALVQEATARRRIEALAAELGEARALAELTAARYGEGLEDYLAVVTASRSVQQAERDLVDANARLVASHIQLHRALGGTWTEAIERREDEQ